MNELDLLLEPPQDVLHWLYIAGWPVTQGSYVLRHRQDIRDMMRQGRWSPLWQCRVNASARAAGMWVRWSAATEEDGSRSVLGVYPEKPKPKGGRKKI